VRLGEGFHVPEPERAPEPDPVLLLLREVLAELRQRPAEPLVVPAPEVRVEAPTFDTSELLQAIAGLRPGVSAEEIAAAVAARVAPAAPPDMSALNGLGPLLKEMSDRIRGIGMQAFGGGGVNIGSDVMLRDRNDSANRLAIDADGKVTISNPVASEGTLAQVRDYLDTVEAKLQTLLDTVATQTTLAAARTVLDDRLPKKAKQFADGRFRTAGGKVSDIALGATGSVTITNPAGSGVRITIDRFTLASDAAAEITYVKDGTSSGTLQAAFAPNRAYEAAGPVVTKGEVRTGSGVLTGGTAISPVTYFTAGSREVEYVTVLEPGMSMSARLTATATQDLYGNVTWVEEPL
jgi:hypothetical protein